MIEEKNNLRELLEEVYTHCVNGNRRGVSPILRHVMTHRREYYQESVVLQVEDEFSDILYKTLLLELDNEEEESIEVAELAYLSICEALHRQAEVTPEQYKRRVLLLHYFCDYFVDSMIEIFLKKYKEDGLLQARSLAIECIEKMQLSDIFFLEEHFRDFIDKDEQFTDACNGIETDPHLSEEERSNAALLHRITEAYLTAKYKY